MKHPSFATPLVLGAAAALLACGDPAPAKGNVQVFVDPEATIPEGLQPGTGEENIQDGWTVTYDKFLLTIGNVRAAQSGKASARLSEPRVYVVDLKNTPAGGFIIASFNGVEATRWDRVGFDTVNATAAAGRAAGLSNADYDLMVQGNYSLYVAGKLTKPGGQSCRPTAPTDCVPRETVAFAWGLKAATSFDDCASQTGEAGFAVPTGGTVQIKPTIHGDHWFFTNITQGAEVTDRKAGWVADSDLNRDGQTTLDELKQVQASDVFPQSKGYNLSGAVIPVSTAHDYLEAQARTLGDYQGDGECPSRGIIP